MSAGLMHAASGAQAGRTPQQTMRSHYRHLPPPLTTAAPLLPAHPNPSYRSTSGCRPAGSIPAGGSCIAGHAPHPFIRMCGRARPNGRRGG